MKGSISCSWCHHFNLIGLTWCEECGHRADQPRQFCDCPDCTTARRRVLERKLEEPPPSSNREDALKQQLLKLKKFDKEAEAK